MRDGLVVDIATIVSVSDISTLRQRIGLASTPTTTVEELVLLTSARSVQTVCLIIGHLVRSAVAVLTERMLMIGLTELC